MAWHSILVLGQLWKQTLAYGTIPRRLMVVQRALNELRDIRGGATIQIVRGLLSDCPGAREKLALCRLARRDQSQRTDILWL